jgi:hypothetical protein
VRGGLADEIKEHFGVKNTGEVLAKVVGSSFGNVRPQADL